MRVRTARRVLSLPCPPSLAQHMHAGLSTVIIAAPDKMQAGAVSGALRATPNHQLACQQPVLMPNMTGM